VTSIGNRPIIRRGLPLLVGVLALAGAGAAVADVTVGGDDGGTVSVGQTLVVTVSDTFSGTFQDHTLGWCNQDAMAFAHGFLSVGPLGPAEGGTMHDLSVQCTPTGPTSGSWTYSGSATVTVPADVGSSEWVSVAVREVIPRIFASESHASNCDCTLTSDYNFNHTYPVRIASTTAATTTAAATTASTQTTATTAAAPSTTTTAAPSTTTTQAAGGGAATVTVTVTTATTTAQPTPTTTTPRPACTALFTAPRVLRDLRAAKIATARQGKAIHARTADKRHAALGYVVVERSTSTARSRAEELASLGLWARAYANVVVWAPPGAVKIASRARIVGVLAADASICRRK
jgi:hypothetical protein